MSSEFELIKRCFSEGYPHSEDTLFAIGDDASLVRPPADAILVQSLDTQVADVHFPANAPANLIAQRALRCAVSDLAAMGARPQAFLLGLTLPHNQPDWLDDFANGLRGIGMQQNTVVFTYSTDFRQWLDNTNLIVGQHDRHQNSI